MIKGYFYFVALSFLFSIFCCGINKPHDNHFEKTLNPKEQTELEKIQSTYTEGTSCLERALTDKDEIKAIQLTRAQEVPKYERFFTKECSETDHAQVLKMLECFKTYLCSQKRALEDFLKAKSFCRLDEHNPYNVSPLCAEKTRLQ